MLTDESLRNVDLPATVVQLHIHQSPLGDETIERWLRNRQLESLYLSAQITRKSAAALTSQHSFRQLYVSNAPLIDEDFRFLKNCRNLELLQLEAMPVRGEFLNWLPAPDKLHNVTLASTLFDDSQFTKLKRFSKLSSIDLDWTPITGEGLTELALLREGCQLRLIGTRLSEKGKDALAAIRSANPAGNPLSVTLPSNWTADDFRRFPDIKPPWRTKVDIFTAIEAKKATGASFEYYLSGWYSRNAAEPLDNTPQDVMAPVLLLHELARQKSPEEESRATREYFEVKQTPATPPKVEKKSVPVLSK